MKTLFRISIGFCVLAFFIPIKAFNQIQSSYKEKSFVILIASYNNEKYARENIISAITQQYTNFRVIFINDYSSDNTLQVVLDTINEYQAQDKVFIIDNKTRKLGLRNYYEAIVSYTRDEEIIVNLDGDDLLANKKVLFRLNQVYNSPRKEVWLTYGQFASVNSKAIGWNRPLPEEVIKNNEFRHFTYVPTHLRTFYSWLFKKINLQDLLYNSSFFEMTWDCAFIFPMLEMSGGRFSFIQKILYLYNDDNPINDHKVNMDLQRFYANYIRALPKYKPLKHSIFESCNDNECVLCNEELKHNIYVENDAASL